MPGIGVRVVAQSGCGRLVKVCSRINAPWRTDPVAGGAEPGLDVARGVGVPEQQPGTFQAIGPRDQHLPTAVPVAARARAHMTVGWMYGAGLSKRNV